MSNVSERTLQDQLEVQRYMLTEFRSIANAIRETVILMDKINVNLGGLQTIERCRHNDDKKRGCYFCNLDKKTDGVTSEEKTAIYNAARQYDEPKKFYKPGEKITAEKDLEYRPLSNEDWRTRTKR